MTTDPLLGQQIKGYCVAELLGEGGMGKVYRAEHPVIGKSIAVKLLHAHLAQDKETLARFLQEAKAANQIKHDNIVDIIDFESTPNGNYFLLMEYLTGKTLEEALQKEAPMPPVRLAKIGLQICSALYAAHKQGIIHRDLKAENVFLITHAGRTDFVKILDFGVAKVLKKNPLSPETKAGSFIGSPVCMAPEQALGMEIDGRADIYSLGVLLYHMATGSPPFHATETLIMLSQHLSEPPPPLRQKNPSVSPQLEALVLRCLEKNREKRPSTMKEVAKNLADCCGVEMIPFFSTESTTPEVVQTTPNIVLPTRKLAPIEENKIQLTPIANPPAIKKATFDLLPTTQLPQNAPETKELTPLHSPEEEWKLSQDEPSETQAFEEPTLRPPDDIDGSTVEKLRAQKKKEPPKTLADDPVSLEDMRRQETILVSSSLEKIIAADIRQQQTEHHLPSVKSARPEILKELSNAIANKDLKQEPSGRDLLRRLETIELANVEAMQKIAESKPQNAADSMMALPSLATLPRQKTAPPWLMLAGLGFLVFVALLYLILG
jgi:serine/threonine protein kinase